MASKITKMYGYYEDSDGTEHGPFRINLSDKLQYEKTAKARKWDSETEPFTTDLFMCWHASRRAGDHNLTFEQFRDTIVDSSMSTDGEIDTEESPTA